MIASYVLSSTLVPVLSVWLFRNRTAKAEQKSGFFARLQEGYGRFAARVVRRRWPVIVAYVAVCIPVLLLAGRIGTELFPRVDTGQFQLRVRAPAGTRLEKTEEIVLDVDHAIREEVGAPFVQITLGNVGNPPWSYPVNAIYTWNSGPQEAVLLVALEPGRRPASRR